MRLPDVAAGRDDIARCDVTAGNDVTAGAGRLPSGAEDRLRPGTAADNFDALRRVIRTACSANFSRQSRPLH